MLFLRHTVYVMICWKLLASIYSKQWCIELDFEYVLYMNVSNLENKKLYITLQNVCIQCKEIWRMYLTCLLIYKNSVNIVWSLEIDLVEDIFVFQSGELYLEPKLSMVGVPVVSKLINTVLKKKEKKRKEKLTPKICAMICLHDSSEIIARTQNFFSCHLPVVKRQRFFNASYSFHVYLIELMFAVDYRS